jgi:hypothetical protein
VRRLSPQVGRCRVGEVGGEIGWSGAESWRYKLGRRGLGMEWTSLGREDLRMNDLRQCRSHPE